MNKNWIPHIFFCLVAGSHFATGQSNTFSNSIGMEFIRIEPGRMVVGKFQPPYPVPEDTMKDVKRLMMMYMGEGRPYNKEEFELAKRMATADFSQGFEVIIDSPYFIGKFEVTQGQWKKVMGDNPSVFQGGKIVDEDSHPVETVTWNDVQAFLTKLNRLEKDCKYRLPTEFEWEYAARAGAETDIPWPEIQRTAQLGAVTTQKIGQKQPNSWGIYDMLGNVWEWVQDYYNEKTFADPIPLKAGTEHVLKGASFVGDVKNATYFTHAAGPGNGWDVGFRVVMESRRE
ncbi:MAG: formylglycine-generating enzyme family protein [Cyclobacteriaceae bacterium]